MSALFWWGIIFYLVVGLCIGLIRMNDPRMGWEALEKSFPESPWFRLVLAVTGIAVVMILWLPLVIAHKVT